MKALRSPLALQDERLVVRIHVRRDEFRGVRIGAGNQDRRHAADVRGESSGDELPQAPPPPPGPPPPRGAPLSPPRGLAPGGAPPPRPPQSWPSSIRRRS